MVKSLIQLATLLAVGTASASITFTAPSLGFPEDLELLWAQYAPWYPAAMYVPPPAGCQVTQVNLLQRHGARYPTKSSSKKIKQSVKQLQGATEFNTPNITFVSQYQYTLGTDDLVPFGAAQSFDAGQEHFVRYANLVNADMLPFVRASDSNRVVDSAGNWSAGFAYASNQKYVPKLSVIISEATNDTLDDNMCSQAGGSSNQTSAWVDVFAPSIADRLNTEAPGANLSNSDAVNLMSLCPFDMRRPANGAVCLLQQSGRCMSITVISAITMEMGMDKYWDVCKVLDETQTNHTLDNSPLTFPLNRTFYADFSHDNEMISIYSALGLFEQPQDLDPTEPNPNRTWVLSKMVPFSARMITEKLACDGSGTEQQADYVRVLVNDAVQPLASCGASGDGLCTLARFVESQSYARNNGEGDWAKCF